MERGGDLGDMLRRRIEFERLFGIEEVYVRARRRDDPAPRGPDGPDGPGGPGGGEEVPGGEGEAAGSAGEADAGVRGRRPSTCSGRRPEQAEGRRRAAVEAARARAREAVAASRGERKGAAEETPARREFVIEDLPSSHDDITLFSEADRAGIPRVSSEAGPKADRLARLSEAASACERCRLAEGRNKVVFGEGDAEAKLVFVGEGPGAEEDRTGRPFVGRAGQLLTKIIEAMNYERKDVYICNVVKCRPPGNRTPRPDEVAACSPFLHEQLAVIRPKAICALGGPATTTLLEAREGITRLRGRFFWYRGIPLMPTFHPAYLLRNPKQKAPVWADVQMLRDFVASR